MELDGGCEERKVGDLVARRPRKDQDIALRPGSCDVLADDLRSAAEWC